MKKKAAGKMKKTQPSRKIQTAKVTVSTKKIPVPPMPKNKKPKAFFLKFGKLLLEKKKQLLQNFATMEKETLGKTRIDASGDNSSTPTHMADIASDNFEQELSLNLLESENKELAEINEALEKINDVTFGLCENCGKPIPEERLRAIPFAKLCMTCKKLEESS